MIRVFIVDDHPVTIRGLATGLAEEPDLEVIGSTTSVRELLTFAERLHPDVVLLDLVLPGMSGFDGAAELVKISPNTRVIAFTGHATNEYVLGAVKSGVKGYVLKDADLQEIARAIRIVHAGGVHLEPRVAARLLAHQTAPQHSANPLSEREQAVLRMIAAGSSNKQIARALGVTERTVKFHVSLACKKLGAANRAQAAATAARSGVL